VRNSPCVERSLKSRRIPVSESNSRAKASLTFAEADSLDLFRLAEGSARAEWCYQQNYKAYYYSPNPKGNIKWDVKIYSLPRHAEDSRFGGEGSWGWKLSLQGGSDEERQANRDWLR